MTPATPAPQKRRFGRASLAAALAALLVVVAGGAWWFVNGNRPTSGMGRQAARLSIVVAPFANLSGDPGQDYLVDALTDELTTALARIRGSFVIARNTAMTFKGKPIDAKAIGKDLGVRYVLEGSVQPSGNQMRVNAQLIDASSGAHLWAEQFDTARADLLQTQDEIVTHLARAIDLQLSEAEAARLKRTPVANPDAEDLALQCDVGQRKAGGSARRRRPHMRSANRRSPSIPTMSAPCWHWGTSSTGGRRLGVSGDPKGDFQRADEFVSKALALDPDWTWLTLEGRDPSVQARLQEAIAEHERALALDPSNAIAAAASAGTTQDFGEFDKSFEYSTRRFRRAVRSVARAIFTAARRRPISG